MGVCVKFGRVTLIGSVWTRSLGTTLARDGFLLGYGALGVQGSGRAANRRPGQRARARLLNCLLIDGVP